MSVRALGKRGGAALDDSMKLMPTEVIVKPAVFHIHQRHTHGRSPAGLEVRYPNVRPGFPHQQYVLAQGATLVIILAVEVVWGNAAANVGRAPASDATANGYDRLGRGRQVRASTFPDRLRRYRHTASDTPDSGRQTHLDPQTRYHRLRTESHGSDTRRAQADVLPTPSRATHKNHPLLIRKRRCMHEDHMLHPVRSGVQRPTREK